jgi:hypothetical protein
MQDTHIPGILGAIIAIGVVAVFWYFSRKKD